MLGGLDKTLGRLFYNVVRRFVVVEGDNNNNYYIQDNVYGAVIMAEPLRELTRFI